MRILITAVGRAPKGAIAPALALDYLKNAELLGARLGFGPMQLREIENRRARAGLNDAAQRKEREADLLLAETPEGAALVALDIAGRTLSSERFAGWLAETRDQGYRTAVFAIGGADGLSDRVTQRAQWRLSLGAMTWPHMLARVMLAEQIYRAVTILANHPYHRG